MNGEQCTQIIVIGKLKIDRQWGLQGARRVKRIVLSGILSDGMPGVMC